jgi:hypothetical protein
MIVRAEIGKTAAIIKSDAYSKRVHTYPAANNSFMLPKDPTYNYKKNHKEH